MTCHVNVRLAVLILPVTVLGHPRQEPTTFRSGIRAVEVDVFVTDRRGNAVRDLTRQDFVVLEDGVVQRLTQVSLIQLPGAVRTSHAHDESDQTSDVLEPAGEGRTLVMMLSSGTAGTRNAARLFVEHAIADGDRMAIVQVLQSATPHLLFTTNRAEMMAAIDRFTLRGAGGLDVALPPADGIAGRNVPAAAYRVAENVATQLGAMSGRRKSLVWISPPALFMGSNAEVMIAQRDVLRAATRHNVAIFAVDSRGLTTNLGRGVLEMKAAYRLLGEETGGEAITDSNNFVGAFQRFLRESSLYYLLTYEPAVEHTDGEFHEIAVRVNRPGVRIRARRGYYAPEPGQ
jgi:VWFA-related protein